MQIDLEWATPISLRRLHGIFELPDLDAIPRTPGVYVFARKQGSMLIPVYIGKAEVLRRRLKQQLNNLRLMSGLALMSPPGSEL